MSLTDVLCDVAGITIIGGALYVLIKDNYLPFTKKLKEDLEKHPELDGYKFPDKQGNKL